MTTKRLHGDDEPRTVTVEQGAAARLLSAANSRISRLTTHREPVSTELQHLRGARIYASITENNAALDREESE